MILIVEGSNKVGKTTFINSLVKNLRNSNIEVEIFNDRTAIDDKKEVTKELMYKITRDDFIKAMKKMLDNIDKNYICIFDRCYLSEYVYGKIFRGYENNEVMRLDSLIAESPFVEQVFLMSSYNNILDNELQLKYKHIQYEMLIKVMQCKSQFSVKFIENENDTYSLAANYSNYLKKKMEV